MGIRMYARLSPETISAANIPRAQKNIGSSPSGRLAWRNAFRQHQIAHARATVAMMPNVMSRIRSRRAMLEYTKPAALFQAKGCSSTQGWVY